jgi:hypothetical protein
MFEQLIAKHTGRDLDIRALHESAPRLADLIWNTCHSLQRTEAELRQASRHLHQTATKIDTSLDAAAGRPAPVLNSLGELQGNGPRVDLLIGLRHQQIETLRGLVAIATSR